MEANKRVAKNTLVLYGRMLLSMFVTLYTSRVVLNILGVDDFGIYNIVAGVIIMFGFLNNAMTASTQRFLTFEIGQGNLTKLKTIFNVSITIHLIIGGIILILAETIGLWFLNTQLNIAEDRMVAANWVYQFSLLSFIISVYYVPYNAVIIAHEKMNIFALIGIGEVVLKLAVVFLLPVIPFDKLIVYAGLLFIVSTSVKVAEQIYCKRTFEECRQIALSWDKSLINEMGKFAGWNLVGVAAGIGYMQVVNVFLNIFFGTVVNAARGIAFQVQGAVSSLITNFQIALAPAITKGYARNELKETYDMVFSSSRLSLYLLLIFSIPLLIETETVLTWWLNLVPKYTVVFTQLIILDLLITSLSGPLHILVQATGNVKKYQIIVSGILLLNVPFAYIFLKLGYSAEITMIIAIVFSLMALVARLMILKNMLDFPLRNYILKVLFKISLVSFIAWGIPYYISSHLHYGIFDFIIVGLVSLLTIIISVYSFGLESFEKNLIKSKVLNVLKG
ncbi:hypothetical protein ACP6L2_12305 [Sphingobacterium lactis]|uniref:hypothetical protein n=1 Tax=Sphingobacterium lactis TaxID=797291 RepID=UPI003F7FF5D0